MIPALALVAALAAPPSAPAARGDALEVARESLKPVEPGRGTLFDFRWRQPIVRMGVYRKVNVTLGSPAISRAFGLVIVGTGEGEVLALSLKDGRVAWRYEYGVPFQASPVIINLAGQPEVAPNEVVVLGSRDGTLLAIDVPTGELRWKATLDGDPRAPARRAGDRLLVSTGANKVFALEAATGKIIWSEGRAVPAGLTVMGIAEPYVEDDVVYATFSDGYAEAYRIEDGAKIWSRPLSLGHGEFADADADPFIYAGKLFVASYADGVYALNPENGDIVWKRDADGVVSLARHGDTVVAASADGWVWGLSSTHGEITFRTRLKPASMSRIIVRDELLMLAAGDTGLVILDAATGRPTQATPLGSPAAGAPAWKGGNVAVLSTAGYLYTLRRARARTPAEPPHR